MSFVRFGTHTILYVLIYLNQTNTNGSSVIITLNRSFPSPFRPNAQITWPLYLDNGGTIGLHGITILTDGNITKAQNSFANRTSVVFGANFLFWINSKVSPPLLCFT